MALKDWIKDEESNLTQISWFNEKTGGFITITNRFEVDNINKKWKVFIQKNNKIVLNTKNNKTKSQASKIARNYRKTH